VPFGGKKGKRRKMEADKKSLFQSNNQMKHEELHNYHKRKE
jgi:hypothetical protein